MTAACYYALQHAVPGANFLVQPLTQWIGIRLCMTFRGMLFITCIMVCKKLLDCIITYIKIQWLSTWDIRGILLYWKIIINVRDLSWHCIFKQEILDGFVPCTQKLHSPHYSFVVLHPTCCRGFVESAWLSMHLVIYYYNLNLPVCPFIFFEW